MLQIGDARYVVIDQVGSVDQFNVGPEPAAADPSGPQAVAPDQTNPMASPPPPGYVQDRADDAEPSGVKPDQEETEYAEYQHGDMDVKPDIKFCTKSSPNAGAADPGPRKPTSG